MWKKLFRMKSVSSILESSIEEGHKLHKALGKWDLLLLGIGATIGAGIFVVTGTAAAGHMDPTTGSWIRVPAGPAIVLSFIVTAIACGFAALCYAEFASLIPIAGSAYTYSYATMGEIIAWIIGWDLVLEYMVGASAVAVGWSGYFAQFVEKVFHVNIPKYLLTPTMLTLENKIPKDSGIDITSFPVLFGHYFSINLPALVIICLITWILVAGIKESSSVNNFIVGLKIAILVIFIIVGAFYAEKSNWMPFAPFGWNGVFTGAALIFFAYIGFDAVSTTAEECKNPGKDLPFGIIGSLIVCTLFYILVSAVMTGICPYAKLGTAEPVATALNHIGQTWLASYIISVGAVIALVSVLLVLLLGQTRVFFSMSRDGFLPPMFSKIHTKYKTPHITTILAGILVAIMAGIGDIGSIAELCNIGTLFAFVLVCAGVIVLRVKDPDRHRSFRTPLVPLVPILGMLTCFYLMYKLPPVTWMRFGVWLAFGLIIYFFYGIKNTRYKTYNGDN